LCLQGLIKLQFSSFPSGKPVDYLIPYITAANSLPASNLLRRCRFGGLGDVCTALAGRNIIQLFESEIDKSNLMAVRMQNPRPFFNWTFNIPLRILSKATSRLIRQSLITLGIDCRSGHIRMARQGGDCNFPCNFVLYFVK
jgi:hypothetical protein